MKGHLFLKNYFILIFSCSFSRTTLFLLYGSMMCQFSYIMFNAAAAAKSLQSCPTLCDPIDGSPPGSPIPGILQARTLEWVAISFPNAGKWKVKVKSLSRVRLFETPWTAAYQAPLSVGFSRQEYWSGLPLPSPYYVSYLSLNYNYLYIYFFLFIIFLTTWRQELCPVYLLCLSQNPAQCLI